MLSREPLSKTVGAFDRLWWAWKFTDFPGPRFQEGLYTLAFLYTHDVPGTNLAGNPWVLERFGEALRFYTSRQHKSGAFDEAYPFEQSLAATAFTGFYVGEALTLLRDHLPQPLLALGQEAVHGAGRWLCCHDEHHGVLSNHLAAAAAACGVVGQLTGDEMVAQRAWHFTGRIHENQHPEEGWHSEYGGPDPGYQSHGMFYLARLWERTGHEEVLARLKKAMAFIQHFVHPNGVIGGEYASRNTKFYYPAAFEMLAGQVPEAGAVADFLAPLVAEGKTVGLPTMDPQNFFPLLNNYLFAHHARQARTNVGACPPLPVQGEKDAEQRFSEGGLSVTLKGPLQIMVGAKKGGVVKVVHRRTGELLLADCGYWFSREGTVYSSQRELEQTEVTWQDHGCTIRQPFSKAGQTVFSPKTFLAFRLVNLTLGRFPAAAQALKNLLVAVLIRKTKTLPLWLTRTVHWGGDGVEIRDELHAEETMAFPGGLHRGGLFSTIHMGSSRYFHHEELQVPADEVVLAPGQPLQKGTPLGRGRHLPMP